MSLFDIFGFSGASGQLGRLGAAAASAFSPYQQLYPNYEQSLKMQQEALQRFYEEQNKRTNQTKEQDYIDAEFEIIEETETKLLGKE